MAEALLRLVRNIVTGRLELHVGLRPDPDGVPAEHEREHRRLLARILPVLDLAFPEDGGHDVHREQIAGAQALG